MLTCKSPRKVMRVAYLLARQCLPQYSNKFSRKDFSLPQLFACLVVKEHQNRSYRGAEHLLRDSDSWLRDIALRQTPDHNALCRAAKILLRKFRVDRLLDVIVRWASLGRILGLSSKPLAVDSTYFESRHVSRHYERRCRQTRGQGRKKADLGGSITRPDTIKRMPNLGIAVASHCHLILAMRTGTGMGADHPHFAPLLRDTRRRVPHRRFKAALDADYDSEPNHQLGRGMGVMTLIPPDAGRPRKDGGPPSGRWRRHMKKMLGTQASRKRCGYTQRWQSETTNSMMKRNLGSALAGKTAHSRKRDLALKVLTHDLMVLDQRVETEQLRPPFDHLLRLQYRCVRRRENGRQDFNSPSDPILSWSFARCRAG